MFVAVLYVLFFNLILIFVSLEALNVLLIIHSFNSPFVTNVSAPCILSAYPLGSSLC